MAPVMRPPEEDCVPCANCGELIFDPGYGSLLHRDPTWEQIPGTPFELQSDYAMVGCRAASFREGKGWNDSLDRKWKAKPIR